MATMGIFQETEGKPIPIHFKMNSFPPGPSLLFKISFHSPDSAIGFPDIYPLDSDFFIL